MKKEWRNQKLEGIEGRRNKLGWKAKGKHIRKEKIVRTTRKITWTEIQQLEKQAVCDCPANQAHSLFFISIIIKTESLV